MLQRGAWKWGGSKKGAWLSFKSSFPKILDYLWILLSIGKDSIKRRNGCYREMVGAKYKDFKEEKRRIGSTDGRA